MTGGGFSNPLVGGSGKLVYPQIQSPNFQTGISGWIIRKDGSAEFNSVNVRGTLTAGVPGTGVTTIAADGNILLAGADGSQVIRLNPNKQRIVVYADPAGAGNLAAAMAAAQTTDQFANTVYQGLTGYNVNNQAALRVGGDVLLFLDSTGAVLAEIQVSSGLAIFSVGSGTGALEMTASKLLLQGSPVDAVPAIHPGSSATPETWQTVTFANAWTQAAAPRLPTGFMITPLSPTQMIMGGSVVVPAAPAAPQAITTAIPAAYRPVSTQSLHAVNLTGNVYVRFFIGSGGQLSFGGPLASVAAGNILDIPPQLVNLVS